MAPHAARRARRLPKFLWQTDPIVETRRGPHRYRLDLRDNVQRAFFFSGWYERRYVCALVGRLRPEDVVVDVGAHIGIHTLACAARLRDLGGGQVIAFEPASDTANLLRWNVVHSGLQNVRIEQVALGSGSGQAQLRSDPTAFDPADMSVRSFYGPGSNVESVAVTSFDSWAEADGLSRMDAVKVDVEGGELAVLEGMRRSIDRLSPRLIGVEIRDYLLKRAGVSESALRAWLRAASYEPVDAGDLEGNFLFVRA